jgi:hypothetical protein
VRDGDDEQNEDEYISNYLREVNEIIIQTQSRVVRLLVYLKM